MVKKAEIKCGGYTLTGVIKGEQELPPLVSARDSLGGSVYLDASTIPGGTLSVLKVVGSYRVVDGVITITPKKR